MRGNHDESETRPSSCRSPCTLPRLQESRLFARRHPPPMRDVADRTAETRGDEATGPDPIDRIAVETAEAGMGDDPAPNRNPRGRDHRGLPADDPPLDRHGRWPLPRSVRGETLLFKRSDVECWLMTGAWPRGVHFRKRPRCPSGRRAFIHDGHRANHRGDDRMDLHGLRPHGGLA